MNYDEINEFLKKYVRDYKYEESDDSNSKENKESNDGVNSNDQFKYRFFYTRENGYGCNDMPGGFQKINPALFIIIGDILGDAISGRMPFNIQNAIGNWIQLVGQAIETYSSQQAYFQSGPGRYYDPRDLNITNPLCPSASSTSTSSKSSQSGSCSSSDNIEDIEEIVGGLYTLVKELKNELDYVKEKISSTDKEINKDSSNITE